MTRHSLWCVIAIAIVSVALPASAGAVAGREPGKAPPAVRLHRLTKHIRVDADGRAVTIAHVEMLATNDAAAMQLGQVPISYDAALATLEITNAYTLKKDGTKIPVDVSGIYDQLAPGAGQMPMYTEYHVKTIVFPQFAAGDTAVYTTTLTQKKALLPGQFWAGETFARTTAYDSVDETIDAPDSLHLQVETHDIEFSKRNAGGRTIFHWHYSAPTPEVPEQVAIAQLTKMPRFFVSTFADYHALGAAIAAEATPKMAVTPAIRALADRITRHVHGRRAKAKALYEWVSRRIRYVAVEFGRGALIPHAASRVLTNGYGDCKDHVTLLGALLKAEGIENQGVLINSGHDYDLTEVPTLAGLNHIITYLPRLHLYLDSTAAVAPFGVLPFNEYGKPIVYAAKGHAGRGTMPVLPPGGADLYTRTVSTLAKDGTLTGTTTTTGRGAYQLAIRAVGLAAQARGPDILGAKIMAGRGYGGDATGTLTAQSPTEPGDSFSVKGTFKATSWKEQAAGSRRFLMPGGMRVAPLTGDGLMGRFGSSGLKDDASVPCYSGHAAEDLSLTAPDGTHFNHVPKDLHVKTAYLSFDARWTLSSKTLSVHRDFTSHINQTLCTPDIRKVNKDALKTISDSYDVQLKLVPEDEGNKPSADQRGHKPNYANAIAHPPEDPELAGLLLQSLDAMVSGENERALRLLNKILSKPDLPISASYPALYNRAVVYGHLGAYDKAISDLDTELAQTPGDARMLLARARIYRKQGKLKLALKDYSEVLKANPHAAMALRGRAAVRLKMHDYQGAIGSYRKYLNPNSADTVRMPVPVEPSEVIDLTSQAERRKTRNTIQRPRHDNPISPIYPPLARRLGEQGKVQVTFTVTTKGRVIHPDIVQSSGYFDLDIAALMTATERHYSPATRHGKPVAVRIRANFNYSLRG